MHQFSNSESASYPLHQAKGIYIVGACGFDSVPADVGQTVVHRYEFELNGQRQNNPGHAYLKDWNFLNVKSLEYLSLNSLMFMELVPCYREMGGDVNSIETFLTVTSPPDLPGPTINFATFQSAIHGFAHAGELKDLRRKIYPERLPQGHNSMDFWEPFDGI